MDLLMKSHQELREKIENDAWDEIDAQRDKNKEELAKIIDAGMKSKVELTLVNNDYKKKKMEKDDEQKKINDKQQ